ncbi:MAG: hypothetical protein ACXVB9_10925 [Bdellovibrionota bacterium]
MIRTILSALFLASLSVSAFAEPAPDCIDRGVNLQVNNEQVIQWKSSTRNQFQARAHVAGPITAVYPDHSGHHHFQIQLDKIQGDTLEVIFNEDFGAVPALTTGMNVEACGDYITSNAPSGPYPASPDNAIIHWVHASPNPNNHPSGFMMVDGVVYGQDTAHAGPKPPHHH